MKTTKKTIVSPTSPKSPTQSKSLFNGPVFAVAADSCSSEDDNEIYTEFGSSECESNTATVTTATSSASGGSDASGKEISEVIEEVFARRKKDKVAFVLLQNGFVCTKRVAETLQGFVYKGVDIEHPSEQLAIKVTESRLLKAGVTRVKGIPVLENIRKEAKLLRSFGKNAPKEIARIRAFAELDKHVVLAMEFGGKCLFGHVVRSHEEIVRGDLKLRKWQEHTRKVIKQMAGALEWLHARGVCHLDVSLENTLIDSEMNVKLCDFGLAEKFNGAGFLFCQKKCGKTLYKCPEISGDGVFFNAKKADVWSLAVVVFMMLIGAPPFAVARRDRASFDLIMAGRMRVVLTAWKRSHYMPTVAHDLLRTMFVLESKRPYISQLLKHPFLSK